MTSFEWFEKQTFTKKTTQYIDTQVIAYEIEIWSWKYVLEESMGK